MRRGFARAVRTDIDKQMATIARIGRRHRVRKPIWATETGLCTAGPPDRTASPQEQALGLEQTVLTLARFDVAAILLHRVWDIPGPNDSIADGCGVIATDGRQKPSWERLRRALASARVAKAAKKCGRGRGRAAKSCRRAARR